MVSRAAVWRTDSRGGKLKAGRKVGPQAREGGRSKEVECNERGGRQRVRARRIHKEAHRSGLKVASSDWEGQAYT